MFKGGERKMVLNVKEHGNTLFISIEGELDHHSSETFKQQVDESIKRKNYTKIVLDMKKLSFMDSSGVGALIGRYKMLKPLGIELTAVNINPQVRKIFDISGLFKVIKDEGELK